MFKKHKNLYYIFEEDKRNNPMSEKFKVFLEIFLKK